jgi:hypothetical protein
MIPFPLWRYLVAGVVATLTMDVGSTVIRKVGITAGLPPAIIGRWFAHILRGRFVHHTIADAPDVPGQLPLALACHYLIGIALTVVFVTLLQRSPIRPESRGGTVAAALAFGALTNALPWLLMFPAMGFGWFGSDGPRDYLLLRSSFLNHLVFGLGLAIATTWIIPLSTAPAR